MTLRRGLAGLAAVFFILAAMSMMFSDAYIADKISRSSVDVDKLIRIQDRLDIFTLKFLSALVGPALIGIGLFVRQAGKIDVARFLIGWGAVIAMTEYIIDLLKWLFGRLRPFQWHDQTPDPSLWFAGGTSFPSGHAGYYAALAGGLAIRFPRFAPMLLLLPVYVAMERMLIDVHHLSDVLTGIGIALLGCAIVADSLRPPAISRKM